jgi:hypothetical protein
MVMVMVMVRVGVSVLLLGSVENENKDSMLISGLDVGFRVCSSVRIRARVRMRRVCVGGRGLGLDGALLPP